MAVSTLPLKQCITKGVFAYEQVQAVCRGVAHVDADGQIAFCRQLQLPDQRVMLLLFVGVVIMMVQADLADDIDLMCAADLFQARPVALLQIAGVAGIEAIGDMDEGMLLFQLHRAQIFLMLTADDEQLADLMRMAVFQDLIDARVQAIAGNVTV